MWPSLASIRGKMQKRLSFVLVAALTAATAMGQSQVPITGPSMEVESIIFTLGSSRNKVVAQVQQAGLKVLELVSQGDLTRLAITSRNLDDKVQLALASVDNEAEVDFRNGVLVQIQKQVASNSINTSRDLASAMYATMQEIERETDVTKCGIKTGSDPVKSETPWLDAKTMMLGCSAGNGAYESMIVRLVTVEQMKENQFSPAVFKRLSR
jgi:hypothetical protein